MTTALSISLSRVGMNPKGRLAKYTKDVNGRVQATDSVGAIWEPSCSPSPFDTNRNRPTPTP